MPSRDRWKEDGEKREATTSRRQEDLSDLQKIDRVRKDGKEPVPWEQAKAELRAQGVDV